MLQVADAKTEAQKLAQLQLGGMVEFTDDLARFMVIGSTGNHYTLVFTDKGRKCNCPDCRIRKRDCKHIRLVLKSIGAEKIPDEWRAALQRYVHDLLRAGAGGGHS